MADSRDDEVPEVKAETSDTSERQKDFTRRALLRAGWVVPAVTAINIPSASAQTPTPHNDAHGDAPHLDDILIHDRHPSGYAAPITRPQRPRRRPAYGHAAAHRRPHSDTPHTDVAARGRADTAHRRAAHRHAAAHRRAAHRHAAAHRRPAFRHAVTRRPCRRGDASRQSWRQPRRSWRSHRRAWR